MEKSTAMYYKGAFFMRRSTLRVLTFLRARHHRGRGSCHQETAVLSAGILLGAFHACFRHCGNRPLSAGGILTLAPGWLLLMASSRCFCPCFCSSTARSRCLRRCSLPCGCCFPASCVVSSVKLRAPACAAKYAAGRVVLLVAGFAGPMDLRLGARALGATLGVCFILEGADSISAVGSRAAERCRCLRDFCAAGNARNRHRPAKGADGPAEDAATLHASETRR